MISSFAGILLLSSTLAVAGAAVGVWLTGVPEVSRKVVPISGAILLFLSLFWVLPELGDTFGWTLGPALMLLGFSMVWLIDKFVYPVCPSCSHTHNHDACSTRLHGFAMPLIVAALIHSIFDGWAMAAGQAGGGTAFREAVSASVLVHRIPESVAYGVILRAALRSRALALLWAVVAQAALVAGSLIELASSSFMGPRWIGVMLALCGGTFLYLGFHAVHGEWKRRVAHRAIRIG